MPTRSDLMTCHASYDADTWGDYEALYKGGKAFQKRVGRFIQENPQEPAHVYMARKRAAHYRAYLGSIIDYFAAYLVTSPVVIRATEGKDAEGKPEPVAFPDDFYARFKEDCDRRDNDLLLFMRRRITEALVKKRAWWLVELPETEVTEEEVASRADWEEHGLGDGHLCALDAEQVLDWEEDAQGIVQWARIFSRSTKRVSPISKITMVTERWEVFETTTVSTYELEYEEGKPLGGDPEVPRVGEPRPHGFGRVPLLYLELDDGLWLANRLASPQTEHCVLSNALSWAIRRTCYAMPILKMEDGDKDDQIMGSGYYIKLGPNDSFDWAAPPNGPFAEIRAAVTDQKDELYRVIHAMALGVENNAAAIGRSAESKVADTDVVRVILGALGTVLREAIERSYSVLARARGDKYEWQIEGLDDFSEVNVDGLMDAVSKAMALNIPSVTFRREVKTRAALALVPTVSQDLKDQIMREIDEGTEAEDDLAGIMDANDDEPPVGAPMARPVKRAAPKKPAVQVASGAA